MKPALALRTTFLFLIVMIISFVINRLTWSYILRPIMELLICYVIALVLVSDKRVEQFITNLPAPHRRYFVIFFFLLLFANSINKPYATFPFVSWFMYGNPVKTDNLLVYEYLGVESSGKKVPVYPSQLFPSLKNSRFSVALERHLKTAVSLSENEKPAMTDDSPSGEPEQRAGWRNSAETLRAWFLERPETAASKQKEELLEILRVMGQEYNRKHPLVPIQRIEIYVGKMSILDGSRVMKQEPLGYVKL